MVLTITSLDAVGLELSRIRKKARGINQRELSRLTTMSTAHICQIENGKSVDTDELARFAKALNIKISIVISMDENDLNRLMLPD